MIGVHNRDFHRSRQRFQLSGTYYQTLLNNLSQAMQSGLSLEQAKAKFSFDKEPVAMRRFFNQPKDISERHLKNIDTIWELLKNEGSSYAMAHNH